MGNPGEAGKFAGKGRKTMVFEAVERFFGKTHFEVFVFGGWV